MSNPKCLAPDCHSVECECGWERDAHSRADLLVEIERLSAENRRLKAQAHSFANQSADWNRQLNQAEADLESLRAVAEQLAAALNGVKHRNSEPGRLCWCDTIAGWYCCGQPQCNAASAAVAAYTALKVVAS